MNRCDRCGWQDRQDRFRTTLVALAREARREGRAHAGPLYDHQVRCIDRDACERRYQAERERRAQAAPDVWSDELAPGGYVCAECGQPTESEPCPDHQRADTGTGEDR